MSLSKSVSQDNGAEFLHPLSQELPPEHSSTFLLGFGTRMTFPPPSLPFPRPPNGIIGRQSSCPCLPYPSSWNPFFPSWLLLRNPSVCRQRGDLA